MAKAKKKLKRWQKVLIVVLIIVAVLAIMTPIQLAVHSGKFSAGNKEEYSIDNTDALPSSPLEGKKILFLGSSVTYGQASLNHASFADYLAKRDGIVATKEAVSGTTLVDDKDNSYVSRLKKVDTSSDYDAIVVQLSTNDASTKKDLGSVSVSENLDDFDTHTVAGAIEYIIVYCRQTWDCPVIFYTSPQYDSEAYGKMVELLHEIAESYDVGVVDMWSDADFNDITSDERKLYMVDRIHPSAAGYREWWTPYFEEKLPALIGE